MRVVAIGGELRPVGGETVLVATREKLIRAATHHTAPASSITHLVTERDTDPAILAAWRTAGTSVHVV